ncbi:hypothetical protein ORL59_27515 [Bacillus cereus]|uniref:hypothetical protein n=1 Tax=Bacillus cereus TaxID=1396 RepID=UPI002AC0CCC1|nr:hypothetical protein [Bacillus cereus]MDZ4417275.1 hypothetical protein [Bacillus cereus]
MTSEKLRLVTKTLLFSTSLFISLLNNEVVKAEQINVILQSKYTNCQHLNIIDKTDVFKEDKEKNKE